MKSNQQGLLFNVIARRGSRCARLTLITLLLCSCRSMPRQENIPLPPSEAALQSRTAAERVAGAVQNTPCVPAEPVADQGLPIPITTISPWTPPGIAGPWPHDEYLHDGGDRDVQVNVGDDREIRGVELEDTVAVYDTLDGRTVVEPSNRVCLYSPRFAAVRKVTSVIQNEQRDQLVGVRQPVMAGLHQDDQLATTAIQPVGPVGGIGTKQPSIERVNEGTIGAISRQPIAAMEGGFAPHENFLVIRQGIFEDADKPRLMEAIDAAIVWSHDAAVQVVLNGQEAVSVSGEQSAQLTFRVDVPDHPCLRVIKVASTKVAKPGDVVDFTIRFDNLGDQTIKHVTLIDNLTTRLEYMPDSAQSSREAEFFSEANEGDSLVMKWEFKDPLPPGQGGLVRFHCRVR